MARLGAAGPSSPSWCAGPSPWDLSGDARFGGWQSQQLPNGLRPSLEQFPEVRELPGCPGQAPCCDPGPAHRESGLLSPTCPQVPWQCLPWALLSRPSCSAALASAVHVSASLAHEPPAQGRPMGLLRSATGLTSTSSRWAVPEGHPSVPMLHLCGCPAAYCSLCSRWFLEQGGHQSHTQNFKEWGLTMQDLRR